MIRFIMVTITISQAEQLQHVLNKLGINETVSIEFGINPYLITRIHPNLFPRAWLCENILSGCSKVFDNIQSIDEKHIALIFENKHVGFIEL